METSSFLQGTSRLISVDADRKDCKSAKDDGEE